MDWYQISGGDSPLTRDVHNGLLGANTMDDSRMERFMLKELLMIIAALVLVSGVLLTVVIFGNY